MLNKILCHSTCIAKSGSSKINIVLESLYKNTINSRYGFDSDGNFKDGNFTNPLWALYDNGNGLLAGGNIRWNTDG